MLHLSHSHRKTPPLLYHLLFLIVDLGADLINFILADYRLPLDQRMLRLDYLGDPDQTITAGVLLRLAIFIAHVPSLLQSFIALTASSPSNCAACQGFRWWLLITFL